jgi:hypothetical protein
VARWWIPILEDGGGAFPENPEFRIFGFRPGLKIKKIVNFERYGSLALAASGLSLGL